MTCSFEKVTGTRTIGCRHGNAPRPTYYGAGFAINIVKAPLSRANSTLGTELMRWMPSPAAVRFRSGFRARRRSEGGEAVHLAARI